MNLDKFEILCQKVRIHTLSLPSFGQYRVAPTERAHSPNLGPFDASFMLYFLPNQCQPKSYYEQDDPLKGPLEGPINKLWVTHFPDLYNRMFQAHHDSFYQKAFQLPSSLEDLYREEVLRPLEQIRTQYPMDQALLLQLEQMGEYDYIQFWTHFDETWDLPQKLLLTSFYHTCSMIATENMRVFRRFDTHWQQMSIRNQVYRSIEQSLAHQQLDDMFLKHNVVRPICMLLLQRVQYFHERPKFQGTREQESQIEDPTAQMMLDVHRWWWEECGDGME